MSENLNKLLFFNIETAGITSSLSELQKKHPLLHDSWENNVIHYIRKWFTEDDKLSSEEVFIKRAAGIPEFAKIICISAAFLQNDNKPKVETWCDFGKNPLDEKEIITKFRGIVEKVDNLGFKLCGHEIKSFTIPCIAKRMLINGLKPPKMFPNHETKPWEIKAIDTKDVWGFASGRGLYSLDVISSAMGIKTDEYPDPQWERSDAHKKYWATDINKKIIQERCKENLLGVMRIMLKINLLK